MGQLLGYFNDGGWMMYPLAAISVLSVAVIVERMMRLRASELISGDLVESVQSHLEAGDLVAAEKACENHPALIARVFGSALKECQNTEATFEASLEESAGRNLQVLWNNFAVLTTVARVAPLMGLLGTVVGMIGAFEFLSQAGGVGKEEMAGKIQVALITTASGMIVAIPTLIAEAYFSSRVRRLLALFEDIFIDVVRSMRIGNAASAAESGKAVASADEPVKTDEPIPATPPPASVVKTETDA